MKHLEINRRLVVLRRPREHLGRPLHELHPPLGDLVRVNVKALGQLSQRDLSLDGLHRHFRFEGGRVIPPWSPGHVPAPCSWATSCPIGAGNPLIPTVQFSGATSESTCPI